VLGFDNPKAFGNAIHPYIERVIHLRKLGSAGLFALGTAVVFQPNARGTLSHKYATAVAPININLAATIKFEKREFPPLPWNN
jgi:hypothetical protein